VARLIVIKGADEGKQFALPRGLSGIGRDRTNRICLHDTEVSRRHAELIVNDNGTFYLRDVGSANGTLVNTRPVETDVQLQAGDHIQIGQSILVLTAGRTEGPPAGDLADRIRVVAKPDEQFSSAIVKTISENSGSAILARPEKASTEWLKGRLANLSAMYETVQAVSHILDLDQLLERIMELIFNTIEADHGCIMLRDPDTGVFEPKAVRFRDGINTQEKIAISRTIMDYVLQERQGVLVADAAKDQRFNTGQSITHFSIREAICVPMKGRHETLGVLFLDTLSKANEVVRAGKEEGGKFTEDHLALAIAIGHQAALAIEETRYHQALVHAERLAAVGQTIAALSHHIKNIMQGIVFGSDLVRTGLSGKDEELLHKGWKLVEKNQGKIHELVMDMLSFSKEREPAIEMTNLNKIVDDVIDVVRGRTEDQHVRLERRLAAGMPAVPADPDGINKALLNIISNALDAVEGQPEPYIGVQTLMEAGGHWARIVIVDHGVGIPADKFGEIFKPFVSSKGSRGTGLGLAVSRKILREHGGDIQVQSQVGKGSKFILRLPMRSSLPAEASDSGEEPALPASPVPD
jgi:two-component system, NtrC family, sensor kinase